MSTNLWATFRKDYRPSRGSSGGSPGGRGSYRSYTPADFPQLPEDRDITEGLLPKTIQSLSRPDVEKNDLVKPKDVIYLGSYNWVDESHPTIIVPGSPPVWQERTLPYRVPFDRGVRYVDQNNFRMNGASCLLPLFRAVDIVAEENADTSLDWSTVDFVTDRNGLRKLMRWLQFTGDKEGYAENATLKDFRIDLQLGGEKTVLMHRWEKRTRELANPPRSGCGINFERESTRPAEGCERSSGHHRIIQYDFGGLKLVVRFEVDACLPSTAHSETSPPAERAGGGHQPPSTTRPKTQTVDVDELADALSNINVRSSDTTEDAGDIDVIHAGTQLPQSSIIELTTRSIKYVDQFDWYEQYPQLLLSSTPHLFLAVHDRGTFEFIYKHELGTTKLSQVENEAKAQKAFKQLSSVLKKIQEIAKMHGPRKFLSLVCMNGELKVYERTNTEGILPDEELTRFGLGA